MGQDNEGAATRRFDDNREELRIDGAKRRIPGGLADADVVVALFALQRLPVHVPELGATHHAERHLKKHTTHNINNAHHMKCVLSTRLQHTFVFLIAYAHNV